MKFIEYIKDKLVAIIIFLFILFMITIVMLAFEINIALIIIINIFLLGSASFIFILEGYRKITFYKKFKDCLSKLDKKYLITEMIQSANFLEGKILLEYLYDIDKNMHEEINEYLNNNKDFKEYIELWCHEIKTPLATTKLIIENNKSKVTKSIMEEINKIENFVEQVLFYSRSDVVEKDYVVSEINLRNVIDNVILKNKKSLIEKKIKIDVDVNSLVNSDSKWLEFILNQIINNSIKYACDVKPVIKISTEENKNNTILRIEDNGIGIDNAEIKRVFDKGFTGSNGRKKYNSTGFGLYLCKKLCQKLGHDISLDSKLNEGTTVFIVFPKSSMYLK